MKKRVLSFGLALVVLLSAMPLGTVFALGNTTEFAGGSGTKEDPYLISDTTHLNNVRNYPFGYFELLNDIEFTTEDFEKGGAFYNNGEGFEPIGKDENTTFAGVFDGNNYAIKNVFISINKMNENVYAGLFASNEGTIKNLGLENSNISASAGEDKRGYVGGITGFNCGSGTISNCYNTGYVTAAEGSSYYNCYAGSIAGENQGIIEKCYNIGDVCATSRSSSHYAYAGGIAGYNEKTISDCYNTGNISTTAKFSYCYAYAGGITGYNDGTINRGYNTGNIGGSVYEGGISGYNYDNGIINNCYYLEDSNNFEYGNKCSLEEMKLQSTYVGFDFEKVWKMSKDERYPFPILISVKNSIKEENIIEFVGGNGTVLNPYKISTKEHLNNVKNHLHSCYELLNDIEFTAEDFEEGGVFYNNGEGFEPIGKDENTTFVGVFDGNNHAIKNVVISINKVDENVYAGFFGYNKGIIKNLGIESAGICGKAKSSSDYPNAYAGGIAAFNAWGGIIENCYNTGDVSISMNRVTISEEMYPYIDVGGIVGDNAGRISNSYNTGNISATSSSYAANSGGIAGKNLTGGTISNCYNTGSVIGNFGAGGISDFNSGTIQNCYNTGDVVATERSSSCSTVAGGIAGFNGSGTIRNCYNIGKINSTLYSGGIAGINYMIVENCYYLEDLNDYEHGTKCSFDEMKDQSTYIGFDFEKVWTINENPEYILPELKDCPHKGTALLTKPFVDVNSDDWFKPYVDYAVEQGIFKGTSDVEFEPLKDMTRAQFVQVFANLSCVDTNDTNVDSGFIDVESGQWYAPAVKWASENGIVKGVGDGKFEPDAKVTREQMCLMLVNYMENFKNSKLDEIIAVETFKDDDIIHDWAKDAVYKCAKSGLVKGVGDGNFEPIDFATRAAGATLFTNFHKDVLFAIKE